MRSIRLRRAATLLETGEFNVSEAAYQVGFLDMSYFSMRSLSENSVVGPRASVFSPDKDGEAGDVFSIVDTAGCRQADNSGCLDPPVNKTVQENKPLEARSSSSTGS